MKEEKTELISLWVTPEKKKEYDLAKDNKELEEEIIRRYFASEKKWIEEELKGIDESVVRYRAGLITIKDKFSEAQDSYVAEIEKIWEKANNTFKKVDLVTDKLKKKTESSLNELRNLSKFHENINTYQLEKLLELAERYSKLNSKEKELIKELIKS